MKEKKYITTIIVIAFILMTGVFYGYANIKENKTHVTSTMSSLEEVEIAEEKKQKTEETETAQELEDGTGPKKLSDDSIYVHICGHVKNPGVYELANGSRISDGIKAAGGLKKKAAANAVNQAKPLEDGEQIYIPSLKEVNAKKSEGKQQDKANVTNISKTNSSKINLNLATKEELMSLPGIGESKANSILTYREEHGNFETIEDIKNITGIKDGVFNSISDYITV